MMMMVVAVRIF